MMKINANSLKIGNLITHNNELWTVVKLNHVKPGKGGAFVQTELKNGFVFANKPFFEINRLSTESVLNNHSLYFHPKINRHVTNR